MLTNNIKVKICGIRTIESAVAAIDAGADFLGFNFVSASKRFIDAEKAKKIIKDSKGKTQIVGVFMNDDAAYINKLVNALGLDYVQLHGNETNEFCKNIHAKVIKTITISDKMTREEMKKYTVDYFMVDIVKEKEGTVMDYLSEASEIAKDVPIFLAGRLNSNTVSQAIKIVHPFAVDVARGIETDGVADGEKIKKFINKVKKK